MNLLKLFQSYSLGLMDVQGLNYFERCNVLNSNAVLFARHFQDRVEIYFKEILLIGSGALGKVKYYAIRVEFQFQVHHIYRDFSGY